MEILIGKLQDDGMVKYIPVSWSYFDAVLPLLKNFYRQESRVDALLKLGRLRTLGPSPYGNFKWGTADSIHCCAEWRDYEDKRTANKFKIVGDRKRFVSMEQNFKFLFEKGSWTVMGCGREEDIRQVDEFTFSYDKSLKNYEVREMKSGKEEVRYNESTVSRAYFGTWREMIADAQANCKTYYVFSNKKLIRVVNP